MRFRSVPTSDTPASPWRQRPVDLAIEGLREIRKIARTVYFAVDAISPSYLEKLSTALARSGLGLNWCAEVRLEKKLACALPKRLREGGCVALSFGYESGSQRILDLLDKGVDLKLAPAILEAVRAAGIGAQMMGFTDFPGERPEERQATFGFLLDHRKLWTLASIGPFLIDSPERLCNI